LVILHRLHFNLVNQFNAFLHGGKLRFLSKASKMPITFYEGLRAILT
jgi:hypothetical protein